MILSIAGAEPDGLPADLFGMWELTNRFGRTRIPIRRYNLWPRPSP